MPLLYLFPFQKNRRRTGSRQKTLRHQMKKRLLLSLHKTWSGTLQGRPDPAPDLRWPPSGNFGEIRRLLQPTPHARRQPPIKAFVGSCHRLGPRPQRPQDIMARRCHHADRGDGGICPRRLDRPRLANRPRFHALSADAVRCLLFRFISLILGVGELPNSEQSKFQ